MREITIFADFNNVDAEGRIVLDCTGTFEDLEHHGLELAEGMSLRFSDGELATEGVVKFSKMLGRWVAIIDWHALKPCLPDD